ncbi:MAG: alpha/beta hydrolase [Deltaproteobacteria bacterium]|nr:alpha/beta hydrolase [Nannocystaceae bacterium]
MTGPSSLPPALDGPTSSLVDDRAGRIELYGPAQADSPDLHPVVLIHSVNAAASAYEMRPLFERVGPTRPTYALDLPGFGRSDRSARRYDIRLMTDAVHAAVDWVRRRHDQRPVDAIALSLSCEFLARAADESPAAFRNLALIAPTGMSGARRFDGADGTNRGNDTVHAVFALPGVGSSMFWLLTRPRVVRYFLRRTYGRAEIDEGMWRYAVETAAQPGAFRAPLWFLSAHLFSADITRVYERLDAPVWVTHGTRGDFVDYRGADPLLARDNWSGKVFDSGALPHFEHPDAFVEAYLEFLHEAAQ